MCTPVNKGRERERELWKIKNCVSNVKERTNECLEKMESRVGDMKKGRG